MMDRYNFILVVSRFMLSKHRRQQRGGTEAIPSIHKIVSFLCILLLKLELELEVGHDAK